MPGKTKASKPARAAKAAKPTKADKANKRSAPKSAPKETGADSVAIEPSPASARAAKQFGVMTDDDQRSGETDFAKANPTSGAGQNNFGTQSGLIEANAAVETDARTAATRATAPAPGATTKRK